jgi:undecaprenyl-diphosphatase
MRGSWIGWTVGAVCLALFLVLALQVGNDDDAVWRFDREVAAAMQTHAADHPGVLEVARSLTDLGGVPVMTALAIVGSVLLWMCGRQRLAAGWLLAAALGSAVNVGTKAVFARPRPGETLRDSSVHERNASFPSGHAMGTVIGYGTLAYAGWVLLRRRSAKVTLTAVVAILVLSIGCTRIYLRAHWCSDVVAGFALGLGWLALCITLLKEDAK